MMHDQKTAIEGVIQSMKLRTKNVNFASINAKTKNLGDRRFDNKRDLQGKIFDKKEDIPPWISGAYSLNE